ncbi:MAG: hypothetical protein HUU55_17920 [Myxococcales bacterium]|nr:hypothetical protein [Myxococcales bacterium]
MCADTKPQNHPLDTLSDVDNMDTGTTEDMLQDWTVPKDTLVADLLDEDTDIDAGADGIITSDTSDTSQPPDAFNSHTVKSFKNTEAIIAFGGPQTEPTQVKFVLTHFDDWGYYLDEFLDPTFYQFHDEWCWFRLLNGVAIPDYPLQPISGQTYATVTEITQKFSGKTELPLGLKFIGDRLYLPQFYTDSFGPNRFFGAGSLVHYDANPNRVLPEELWLFDLEYPDTPSPHQIAVFFQRLKLALPKDVGDKLRWLVRSEAQEQLGNELEKTPTYTGKIVTYGDLVVAGDYAIYNSGITAGKIRVIPKGSLAQTTLSPYDIVVLDEIPDYIPPVAAIITAVPQTPLAHINLLAKSRGTPNLYIANAAENPEIHDLIWFKKTVILNVTPAGFSFQVIGDAEYSNYLSLIQKPTLQPTQVDWSTAPYWIDLTETNLADKDALLPFIGGKSANMCAFFDFPQIIIPDKPIGLTIRSFAEHTAELRAPIKQLLDDPLFQSDPNFRYVVLEGKAAYSLLVGNTPQVQTWLEQLSGMYPKETFVGQLMQQGGLRSWVETKPIDPSILSPIYTKLTQHYANYSVYQGIRFRSSSTAEDIEGFNGAGLYESNTGFLYPDWQSGKDKKKTVEAALRATWSSYYGFQAWEERTVAGIDHLTANMGVLVHARFDDDKELNNGVFTLELVTRPTFEKAELIVNVQKGSLSVTNPVPGNPSQPEIDVVQVINNVPVVVRIQPSTEVDPGDVLLTDQELFGIHQQAIDITDQWLKHNQAALPPGQRPTSLTLDFEFRTVADGWPLLSEPPQFPSRTVWKQVRPLQHPIHTPSWTWTLPIPRDVLPYVAQVWKGVCENNEILLSWTEITTDDSAPPHLTYTNPAFVVKFDATFPKGSGPLGLSPNTIMSAGHDECTTSQLSSSADIWELEIVANSGLADSSKITQILISSNGTIDITGKNGGSHTFSNALCSRTLQSVSSDDYLKSLLTK